MTTCYVLHTPVFCASISRHFVQPCTLLFSICTCVDIKIFTYIYIYIYIYIYTWYHDFTVCAVYGTVRSEYLKLLFVMFCVIMVSRSKLLSGKEVLDIMNVLDQYLITDSNEDA